jgi:hypothetical protein
MLCIVAIAASVVYHILEFLYSCSIQLDKLNYINYLINLLVLSLKTKLLNKSKNSLYLLLMHENKHTKSKKLCLSNKHFGCFLLSTYFRRTAVLHVS